MIRWFFMEFGWLDWLVSQFINPYYKWDDFSWNDFYIDFTIHGFGDDFGDDFAAAQSTSTPGHPAKFSATPLEHQSLGTISRGDFSGVICGCSMERWQFLVVIRWYQMISLRYRVYSCFILTWYIFYYKTTIYLKNKSWYNTSFLMVFWHDILVYILYNYCT